MLAMEDPGSILSRAATQLIHIEQLLGCDFVPAHHTPLPEVVLPHEQTAGPLEAPMELTPDQKAAAMAELSGEVMSGCQKCILHRERTNIVFGEGDVNAKLVFVGEGPGRDEDECGRPFVGKAGQLLTKMIGAMGLTREQIYICNMVKCRPPQNRTPMPEEIAECWPYLIRQLQIIRPKVIVTLGNPATQNLLRTKIGITKLRGQWQPLPDLAPGLEGIAVMPTFHPSYVQRVYTPENRANVWSDLKQVMSAIGQQLPAKETN